MADSEIFGVDLPKPGEPAFWVLAGAAVGLVILLRRRSSTGDQALYAAQGARAQAAAEFARITADAGNELAQLTSMNRLEETRLNLEFQTAAGGSPGLQTRCVPWGQYLAMDKASRMELSRQIRDGALIATPSAKGMCYSPTMRGLSGAEPRARYSRSRGLLGSGERYVGPSDRIYSSGGRLEEPGIGSVLDSIGNLWQVTRPQRAKQPRDPGRMEGNIYA
jgi:hypothetical protein